MRTISAALHILRRDVRRDVRGEVPAEEVLAVRAPVRGDADMVVAGRQRGILDKLVVTVGRVGGVLARTPPSSYRGDAAPVTRSRDDNVAQIGSDSRKTDNAIK